MKIIVGLGNPGKKYTNTRHNIGFKVLEELAGRYTVEKEKVKYEALIANMRIGKDQVLLVKPLTYMNLSGNAVRPLVNWFKIDMSDLLVVYDDMDLEPGVLRIRASGGTGGHKGMESICKSLGTKDFSRIRIGIGKAPDETIAWVLGEFSNEEKILIDNTINKAGDAIECWVKNGIDAAMNTYN